LQTLLALIADHEITIIATLLPWNWKSTPNSGLTTTKKHWTLADRVFASMTVEHRRSNTSARL